MEKRFLGLVFSFFYVIGMRQLCLAMFAVWCLMIAYLICVHADEINIVNNPQCYKVDRKFCPNDGNPCRLNKTSQSSIKLYCCNVTNLEQIDMFLKKNEYPRGLTALHIRDSSFGSLNLNSFDRVMYSEVMSLAITDSKILHIGRGFEAYHPMLTCLEVSNNVLSEFATLHILTKLGSLKKLVLANNTDMTSLPYLPNTRTFIELDVSNNKALECKYLINITESVFRNRIQIYQLNKKSTFCEPPNIFYGTKVEVQMSDIDQVTEIYRNCPSGGEVNCSCTIASLEILETNRFVYHAHVNCSGLQLTSLPKILPPYTLVLDVSNNSITSLEGINNRTYNGIKALYADHNSITSLKPLEGAMFLDSFQNLSLTYNKIDYIPRHILTNVFDRNPRSARLVLLAKNTLVCQCDTATETKTWLQTVRENVPDYQELLTVCDGVQIRVVDMNPKDYCSTNQLYQYLKLIIFAEVTLFVLLVAKVSYDYYVFKTAGYLPWPASKMPKLPCDWCFET